jgi:CO dehydrogenase maturation factor
MRIAIVGKGGAGKSLIAGTMARFLARAGRRVVVLDSDPLPGLAISLGLGALTDGSLTDATEKGEDGRWKLRRGIGAARAVQRFATVGPDGVRLLQFGKATPEGLGPAMASLNGIYQVAHRLAGTKVLAEWDVIGDLPAGPRQTAFRWAPYARLFVVVTEPTWKSILSARRIRRIALQQTGASVSIVANKVSASSDVAFIEGQLEEKILATIPLDDSVLEADRLGVALIDHAPGSAAVAAIQVLGQRLVSA